MNTQNTKSLARKIVKRALWLIAVVAIILFGLKFTKCNSSKEILHDYAELRESFDNGTHSDKDIARLILGEFAIRLNKQGYDIADNCSIKECELLDDELFVVVKYDENNNRQSLDSLKQEQQQELLDTLTKSLLNMEYITRLCLLSEVKVLLSVIGSEGEYKLNYTIGEEQIEQFQQSNLRNTQSY